MVRFRSPPEPVPYGTSHRTLHPQGAKRGCQRALIAPLALPVGFGRRPGLVWPLPVGFFHGSLPSERRSWERSTLGVEPICRSARGVGQRCACQPVRQSGTKPCKRVRGRAIANPARLACSPRPLALFRHVWPCVSPSAMLKPIQNVWERARDPVPIGDEQGARTIQRLA